jgi:hypothetical protein
VYKTNQRSSFHTSRPYRETNAVRPERSVSSVRNGSRSHATHQHTHFTASATPACYIGRGVLSNHSSMVDPCVCLSKADMLKLTQIAERLPGTARGAHGNVHCTPLDGPKQRQFDGKKHCSADLSAACTTGLGSFPHVQDHLTMLEGQHAQNFKCRLVISPTRTSKCFLPIQKSCLDAPHMCAGGPARTIII